MESYFKLAESFNEIVKRKRGTEYHRSTHGFKVVLPLLHKIRWQNKNNALSDFNTFCNS